MATPTVYLVSGANRGLGLGLVTQLVARENVTVFAGARNPDTASDLQALTAKYPNKLHIVKLVSADEKGNRAAVEEIKRIAGRLDVVIANAGIGKHVGPALTTPPETMREHYEVNVVGTLVVFQATYPLLKASTSKPKFFPISSGAGTMSSGARFPFPVLPYGASKAAENHMSVRLYYEYPDLICYPIEPGAVETDLMKAAGEYDLRIAQMPKLTPEEAAANVLKRVDELERTEEGASLVNAITGETRPW